VATPMNDKTDWYLANPLTRRDRRLDRAASPWTRSFACNDPANGEVTVLIVCRGPIRLEAIDIFAEMGITKVGILLSEKDSIVYQQARAPELRRVAPDRVHRIRDYTGATTAERAERIDDILSICKTHGYGYVFAGYGFMAESAEFVAAIEGAGLRFMGPCSHTQRAAGSKDEARRTALAQGVSVTPGVNDVTARALAAKAPTRAELAALAAAHGLDVALPDDWSAALEAVLQASYAARVDVVTLDEVGAAAARAVAEMFVSNPGARVRIKAIGGGGGKGQRIIAGIARDGDPATAAARADEAVRDVSEKVREALQEVKASGVGDNKNVVVELNIETTRHNEIQMIGNGQWCVTLGGRDCSLQMHEQKLLEVSVTQEGLRAASTLARAEGRIAEAEALAQDLETLRRMEDEAERFGRAVGLDSASTFECIVDGARHYFMEVNTRIQVEHRVSEFCYALRFTNPDDATESFDVHSVVECMVLLARHGARLPKPTRVPREGAAVEARLNATNRALRPHAGALVIGWSDAIEGEVRDDQGICLKHPDTGLFVHYRLAGAYDSNIALLVTTGDDRRASYARLAEVLRRTRLRGHDLATNLEFHHGLVSWFAARNVWAKPTTRFVVPYLSLVGLLKEESDRIDVGALWAELAKRAERRFEALTDEAARKAAITATREVYTLKETLVRRAVEALFEEPHRLSAWLSQHMRSVEVRDGRVQWHRNPVEVLADTYHLFDMDWRREMPAAQVIWDHDHELLERAKGFYRSLDAKLGGRTWAETVAALSSPFAPAGLDEATWAKARAAHEGFQAGIELLGVAAVVGARVGFYELRVEDDLTVTIPERLHDATLATRMARVLVPPPATRADEIVAEVGGMFYAQESPDRPAFVKVGDHVEKDQPLYILEVMKMFNRVLAPFAARIDAVLIEGVGTIVQKGQTLFKVTPAERHVEVDTATLAKERKATVATYLAALGA
jgi:acetyl/propionyl-CoA carboxylase alpha subunit